MLKLLHLILANSQFYFNDANAYAPSGPVPTSIFMLEADSKARLCLNALRWKNYDSLGNTLLLAVYLGVGFS